MITKHPTIVIINGANWVGARLVELMIEQKGNVIVVDDFTDKNMPFIKKFAGNKHFIFIEKDKIKTIRENFTHIKYFIHLKHDFDTSNDRISSKYFIAETKFVDDVLSLALEKNSAYILTSSIHLHKDFLLKKSYIRDRERNAYNESDLQDYIEKTVEEYVSKAGLNGRIVRLGNIYGAEMDLDKDPLFKQILTDAFYRDEIRIYGDGLEYMYYVYINDAIQGILRALFTDKTKGKIYSITNPEEISVLSIVNKVLGLQPRAKRIKFVKTKGGVDPLYERAYIPDENLNDIGWKPNVGFDRGIAQVFDYFRKDVSLRDASLQSQSDFDENEPEDNEIQFHFDDTVNLANSFFGGNQNNVEVEHQQFTDFYQKLHSEDSPIYNLNKKKKSGDTEKNQLEEPISKLKAVKYVIYLFLIFLLLVFLIIPLIRFGLFFTKLKSTSESLNTSISTNYKDVPEFPNFNEEARSNFAAVRWALQLSNQQKVETDITSIGKGLDNAILASQEISKSNLAQYLTKNDKIPESSIAKVQDILQLLNSAKTQLEPVNQVNLPFETSEKIMKIRNWAYETEKGFSEKMRSE